MSDSQRHAIGPTQQKASQCGCLLSVTVEELVASISRLHRHDNRHLTFVHEPRKLPIVLSPEEVARLLEAAPGVKYKAALSVAYGAGLRVSEIVSLKVSESTASV